MVASLFGFGDAYSSDCCIPVVGADPTGVNDSSVPFAEAWNKIKLTGGTIVVPPGTYLLNSQWQLDLDQAAPHNYQIVAYGAVLKSGVAVTDHAVRIRYGYNNFGLRVEGLGFDQRTNTTAQGCISAFGTQNLSLYKCVAELGQVKTNWSFIELANTIPGDEDTGCFWTTIENCTTRARFGADLFISQTSATTQVTLNSDLITVASVSTPLSVGLVVFDLAGYPIGGQNLIPVGSIIVAQVSGTPGGAGVYRMSSKALGTSSTDTLAFAKYAAFGVRMRGSQNATRVLDCSFSGVVDAIRFDVDGVGNPVHPNGVRIERNDFEGVVNAIKVNTDAPAIIMPTGLMASHNRVESSYSYFNVGSDTPCIADAASFTGSIAAGTNVLTASSVTGTITVGATINGANVINPSIILAQLSGTTGGAGTYSLSLSHPFAIDNIAMTISGVRTLPNHSTPPVIGPDYTVTGSADNYILNPNHQIVYGFQSTYYAPAYSQVGGPADYTIITEGAGKNFHLQNLSGDSSWNTAHMVMGQRHYWTDQSGNFRTKTGEPLYDTDGTVVGLQGIPTQAPTMDNLFVNPWFNIYGANPTTGVWGVSGGPPQGCTTTPVGVVWSATPPSPCPQNPTGQAARIQSIGTTVSNGLILSLNSAQLTAGDTISCGMWVLSPNLSTAKAVVYATDGAGATAILGSNTVANTWQFIKWTQPVNTLASAVVYVAAGTGASFVATVPYGSNIMTVSSVTGTIAAGSTLMGSSSITGLDIHPFGATVTIQAYGTSGTTGTGGAGTYALSSTLTREVTAQSMNTVTSFVTNTVVWAGAFHMVPGAFAPQTVSDSFEQDRFGFEVNQQGDTRFKQRVLIGATSPAPAGTGTRLQIYGNAATGANSLQRRFSADASGPALVLSKTRGATPTDVTLVQNGDALGSVSWQGSDGAAIFGIAAVGAYVDGVASAGSLPTMITVATTPSGATAAAERIRFRADGTTEANGTVWLHRATAIPAGGTTGAGLQMTNAGNFGVFFGSGAPTLSAAQGSLYLRSDGNATNNRMYVNTNGSTGWTAVTTVI